MDRFTEYHQYNQTDYRTINVNPLRTSSDNSAASNSTPLYETFQQVGNPMDRQIQGLHFEKLQTLGVQANQQPRERHRESNSTIDKLLTLNRSCYLNLEGSMEKSKYNWMKNTSEKVKLNNQRLNAGNIPVTATASYGVDPIGQGNPFVGLRSFDQHQVNWRLRNVTNLHHPYKFPEQRQNNFHLSSGSQHYTGQEHELIPSSKSDSMATLRSTFGHRENVDFRRYTNIPRADFSPDTVPSCVHVSQANISPQHVSQTNISQQQVSQTNISPRQVSQTNVSPRQVSQTNVSPRQVSQTKVSPKQVSQTNVSPRQVSQTKVSPRQVSQTKVSPKKVSQTNVSPRQVSQTKVSPKQVSQTKVSPRQVSQTKVSHKQVSQTKVSPKQVSQTNVSTRLTHEHVSCTPPYSKLSFLHYSQQVEKSLTISEQLPYISTPEPDDRFRHFYPNPQMSDFFSPQTSQGEIIAASNHTQTAEPVNEPLDLDELFKDIEDIVASNKYHFDNDFLEKFSAVSSQGNRNVCSLGNSSVRSQSNSSEFNVNLNDYRNGHLNGRQRVYWNNAHFSERTTNTNRVRTNLHTVEQCTYQK
ncbi:hypothetical protein Btru_055810 [Bulinus truncatus]|nr:hypothetical protein Btru_055810 [Bulinus truncatus]